MRGFIILTTICIIASFAFAQKVEIDYTRDNGTDIEFGKAVRVVGSGIIDTCTDNDFEVMGVITNRIQVAGTYYYDVSNFGMALADMRADVVAGDQLTTAAGGELRKAEHGEVRVGFAMEAGHATELRRIMLAPDYRTDFDTLANYARVETLSTYAPLDTLTAYLDTTNSFFQQLRADGNPWLTDSTTFVSGDNITLTQTGDSITFDVDWDTLVIYVEYDTLVAYADTVFVNSILDSLSAYADTSVVWDTLSAYLDTTNNFFTQLRADGNPWLPDSVTLISGSGINLTQTGDSITIATAGGSDTDWLRNAAWTGNMLYTYNTTDSVAVGLTSATAKLDVDGGITMRGDRYRGIDASGADSFYIYDDGDTTFFDADNPIKIGDASLIVETDGDVIASQKMHVLDMPDTSKVRHVVVVDTSNGQLRTQTFAESVIEATIFSYAEMYETDSTLYDPLDEADSFIVWNSGTEGLSAGTEYIVVADSLGTFTIGANGGGRYFVMFATSVKAQGANQQYQFAVFKNGTLQPNLNFRMYTTNANGFYGATVSGFLNLVEDDELDFRFKNLNNDTGVRFFTVNFNMQKVGNL